MKDYEFGKDYWDENGKWLGTYTPFGFCTIPIVETSFGGKVRYHADGRRMKGREYIKWCKDNE